MFKPFTKGSKKSGNPFGGKKANPFAKKGKGSMKPEKESPKMMALERSLKGKAL